MMLTQAGGLVGLDVRIDKDGDETVASVKIYPHHTTVRVSRTEDAKVLFDRIWHAVTQLYAHRGDQF